MINYSARTTSQMQQGDLLIWVVRRGASRLDESRGSAGSPACPCAKRSRTSGCYWRVPSPPLKAGAGLARSRSARLFSDSRHDGRQRFWGFGKIVRIFSQPDGVLDADEVFRAKEKDSFMQPIRSI